MKSFSFSYKLERAKVSQIHCYTFGVDPLVASHVVVALHGYSDSAAQFRHLEPFFEAMGWYVVAPELPFHGKTEWAGETFSRIDLEKIILQSVDNQSNEGFSLLGFSYGARLALCLNTSFGDRLRGLWLVAPEGIASAWMGLANNTPSFVRSFMIRKLNNPEKILNWTQKMYEINILPKFVHAFTKFHLSSEDRRKRLFAYWLATEDFLLYDLKQRLGFVPVQMFMGKDDDMFPLKKIEAIVSNYQNIEFHIIENQKHQLLNLDFCQYLIEKFGFSTQKIG